MTINQATDYAFRAVYYLAKRQEVVEAKEIAEQEAIPMRYLLKIMPSLVKHGIVKSYRGTGGGYALARNPQNISFLDVVEAIEGPLGLNRCLYDSSYCSKNATPVCAIHRVLADVQHKLKEELQRHKFSDLFRELPE